MSKKIVKKTNKAQETFCANVTRLRKAAGITQLALAKKAGITHNFINDIENQKKWVSSETLDKLAKALEVDLYQFFLSPAQCSDTENQQIAGIIESLRKELNKILDNWK